MMYHIFGLCPRTDISLGRCGFGIKLYPAWRNAVAASGLTQATINSAIKNLHRAWLDGCGYDKLSDPGVSIWEEQKPGYKPGQNARPLYDVHSIRIAWGEWGPEHISVPGNACGLDISDGINAPENGRILTPHNVDSFAQVILLLTIFTTLADRIVEP
jgi:hypothetical protein